MTGSASFDHRAPVCLPGTGGDFMTRVTLGWTRSGAWIGVTRTGPHPDAIITVLHQGGVQAALRKVYDAAGWAAPQVAPEPTLALQPGDVIVIERSRITASFEAVMESLDGQTLGCAQGATPEEALARLHLTAARGA